MTSGSYKPILLRKIRNNISIRSFPLTVKFQIESVQPRIAATFYRGKNCINHSCRVNFLFEDSKTSVSEKTLKYIAAGIESYQ